MTLSPSTQPMIPTQAEVDALAARTALMEAGEPIPEWTCRCGYTNGNCCPRCHGLAHGYPCVWGEAPEVRNCETDSTNCHMQYDEPEPWVGFVGGWYCDNSEHFPEYVG